MFNLTTSETNYLDFWRNAFYGVLLAVIYSKVMFDNTLITTELSQGEIFPFIFFTIFMTVYLLLDGITRFNSRKVIKKNLQRVSTKYELLWLLFEIIGLLFISLWMIKLAISFGSDVPNYYNKFSNYSYLIGFFCIVNFFHNSLLILADVKYGIFNLPKLLFIMIFNDASKISVGNNTTELANKWIPYWINLKKSSLDKLKKADNECRNRLKDIKHIFINNTTESQEIHIFLTNALINIIKSILKSIILLIKKTFKCCLISFKLGFTCIIVEYFALHFIIFNLIAGIIIIDFIYFPLLDISIKYWLIFLLLIILAYSISSYCEMRRLLKYPNNNTSGMLEKIFQIAGNLIFIYFFTIFFAFLIKPYLIILIIAEGAFFSICLLWETNPKSKILINNSKVSVNKI